MPALLETNPKPVRSSPKPIQNQSAPPQNQSGITKPLTLKSRIFRLSGLAIQDFQGELLKNNPKRIQNESKLHTPKTNPIQ